MYFAWTLSGGIALAVGLAFLFMIIFGSLLVLLGFFARRKEAEAWRSFPTAIKIDRAANFFGQQSRRVMQVRGNGTLILTAMARSRQL
jgi:hypothetical protein